ncbi:MAG: hypothetical protein ACOCTM_03165 [Bacteroidota bacterium]
MVWDIQQITGMTKMEVLNQIYPDELEIIFEKKREKKLRRYMGYLNQIMAVSAGFGGGDAAQDYVQDVIDQIKFLSNVPNSKPKEKKEHTKESLKNELKKIR